MQYFLTITILDLILMHSKLGFEMIFHSIQSFRFLSHRYLCEYTNKVSCMIRFTIDYALSGQSAYSSNP